MKPLLYARCNMLVFQSATALAYSSRTGKEWDIALANVKAGFKESSEVIAGQASERIKFMGDFQLRMKGYQGFTIKHAHQRWKTRAKTGKDGDQVWEDLFIKEAEVKTLGKQV